MNHADFYEQIKQSEQSWRPLSWMLFLSMAFILLFLYQVLPAKYPYLNDGQIGFILILSVLPISLSSHILYRNHAKTHQLICPECGLNFIGGKGKPYVPEVLGTGRCPRCGRVILEKSRTSRP